MSSWAKRGARCTCIVGNGGWHDPLMPVKRIQGPSKGDMLTVRSVEVMSHGTYINFEEFPGWWTFNVKAFRPLAERTQEQDVALFTHHLHHEPIAA